MANIGKTLLAVGLALAVVGLLIWWLGPRLGGNGGLLPGDLAVKRGSLSFHFPIVTCLVLSALVTLLLRLFR